MKSRLHPWIAHSFWLTGHKSQQLAPVVPNLYCATLSRGEEIIHTLCWIWKTLVEAQVGGVSADAQVKLGKNDRVQYAFNTLLHYWVYSASYRTCSLLLYTEKYVKWLMELKWSKVGRSNHVGFALVHNLMHIWCLFIILKQSHFIIKGVGIGAPCNPCFLYNYQGGKMNESTKA
jgi:hypothetical protein